MSDSIYYCKNCKTNVMCHMERKCMRQAHGLPDPAGSESTDTDRLIWLRRHISGKEMRRIGICMENTGDTEELRRRIDNLIQKKELSEEEL